MSETRFGPGDFYDPPEPDDNQPDFLDDICHMTDEEFTELFFTAIADGSDDEIESACSEMKALIIANGATEDGIYPWLKRHYDRNQ